MLEANVASDVASYSAVINACAKSNNIVRAEWWLNKMKDVGVAANVVTYNSVINACARCGDQKRAEVWFCQMDSERIYPAVLTFNSLINACVKAGDIPRAEHWLTEISKRGLVPDGISYSTVINACLADQELLRAEQWLEKMHSHCTPGATGAAAQPKAFAYNVLIQAFARKGDAARVERWLSNAHAAGILINPTTYSGAVHAYMKAGKLEEADAWLVHMAQQKIPLPLTAAMGSPEQQATAWTKSGQPQRAAAVYRLVDGARRAGCERGGP